MSAERVVQARATAAADVGMLPGESPASAITVSTLTRSARDIVEGAFGTLWVRGEVSDFKRHRNGHWYFCLRDRQAQVRCVVWARDQRRMPAPPDEGMQVAALGQLTVYPARGEMQLVVRSLEAAGDGLWRKALERTRARLEADGLLDPKRKRALPGFPRCIALITSPDGAALHDIISVARRRWPAVELVLVAARVQGDGAAADLRAAVERVGRWGGADAVIIGRGGGSREDLWAFNDEALARSVAACPVPTISAVGHEVDISICDLVADHRAATPSAAAEAAVPARDDLLAELRRSVSLLRESLSRRVRAERLRLARARAEFAARSGRMTQSRRAQLAAAAGRLHALSPLATLARGYSVARREDGSALTSASEFSEGAAFELLLRDGLVRAETRDSTLGDPVDLLRKHLRPGEE